MTLFEYISVAVSIVIAIGATHLLGNAREVLDPKRRYWVHSVWVGLLLLLYAQLWWTFWGVRDSTAWNFGSFVVTLLGPGLLFVSSTALVPRSSEVSVDWEDHYYSVRKWFFLVLLLYAGWSGAASLLLSDVSRNDGFWLVRLTFVSLSVVGIVTSSRSVHGVIAIAGLVAFSVGQVLFRFLPQSFASEP